MTKWEYAHFRYIDVNSLDMMNKLGQQGWEVIRFYRDDRDDFHIWVKRPIKED